jgi:hypothetical protein
MAPLTIRRMPTSPKIDRALQPFGNAVEIVDEQLTGRGPFGLPLGRPRFGEPDILVDADQSALLLLAEIARDIGAAHHRYLALAVDERLDRVGDDIVMFHVGDRNVDPRHLGDLPSIAAGRVDDDFGAHDALVGDHEPVAGRRLGKPRNQCLADDRRAQILRADRHRVAQPRRVGMAVAGRIGPRDHAIGGHERVNPANLLRGNNLHVEADILRIAVDIFHPRKLALVGRQADAARPVPADILAGQLLQPGIEVVAVGVDLGEVIAAGDARALPRGVPRRARGQLVLFD